MDKNKTLTILLTILVYSFAIMISTYLRYIKTLEQISVGYSGPNTQKIKTDTFLGEYRMDNLKHLFENESTGNYAIFDDSLNNVQLRGILIKGNMKSPRIIEGRFFNETDFFTDKKMVVIGENMIEYTYTEDGKRYLSLFNDVYEVIGICGYGINSIIDNIIFYNLDSIQPADWGVYSIDGNSTTKTNLIVNIISGLGKTEIVIDEDRGIQRLLGYKRHSDKIIYSTIFLIPVLFLIKSRSLFLTIQEMLNVSKFLGFSLYHTIHVALGRWMLYEVIGIIISVAVYSIFFQFSNFRVIINSITLNLILIMLGLFFCSLIVYITHICCCWGKKGAIKCSNIF